VPSSHSVRVQNRQNVKHKFIAQDTWFFAVLCQLGNDTRHDVRTRYLTRVHSCRNYDTFFVIHEFLWLASLRK
jgi:hypothetical protein